MSETIQSLEARIRSTALTHGWTEELQLGGNTVQFIKGERWVWVDFTASGVIRSALSADWHVHTTSPGKFGKVIEELRK